MGSRKVVFGLTPHLPALAASGRRLGVALLLGVWNLGGAGALRAAEPPSLPAQGPPASGPVVVEPGAASLREGLPLQLGLREHGLPGGLEESPAPATPAAQPPAPARPATAERQLVLDRRHKVLRVMESGKELRRYPVAVGMPGWETPVGQFSVIEKRANPTWEHPANGHLLPPGPDNPLGSRWIGFYRDCRGRSGFNGQEHLVVKGCVTAGFHGTPNRASVGRAVSHGCVRLFDEHARELFDLVSLGTPVTVLP